MSTHLDERLVADVGRRLGEGGLHYTDRQLWYATCRELEAPELTVGLAQVAAGVLLTAVGVVFGILATVFVAALVPVGMVITGIGLQNRRLERNRPHSRVLAVSYDSFARQTLATMRDGGRLGGLLPADGLPEADGPAPAGSEGVALIVCDRGETAALLAALAPAQPPTWRAVIEADAPASPGRRVHTLHDADPRGCALPLRLAAAGATEVVDLGLRPGQLSGHRVQVIEGAPYLIGAELSALLTPDEVVWLAEGRRAETAILTPRELAEMLPRALAAPPASPPGAAPAAVALAGVSLLGGGEVAPSGAAGSA